MSLVQQATFLASLTLLPLVLAGVLSRRLYRICYTFAAYLLAVWLGDLVMFVWPEIFYVWSFWLAKETLYAVLKLALALEITALAYGAFPAARTAVRRGILLVLAALAALLAVGVPYGREFPVLASELQRRLAQGTALVFCATWALLLWYHLPLHRLHRAIMRGLVPYMLVFAAVNGFLVTLGLHLRPAVNLADGLAWAMLLLYWSWEVWRRPPLEPPFLRTLQPWRGRVG
jgi:hypothetical protein